MKTKKPLLIKRGNVTVKLYTGKHRVGRKTYPRYVLAYYADNARIKRNFADLDKAKEEAALVATKLANGEHEVIKLTATDRISYVQALEHLRPLNVPLPVAVLEYTSAVKQLPKGATLKEAVDFFRRRNPASLEKRTVRQVVDELLAAKRAAKLSAVHVKDLESRLVRFAEDFQMNIAGVSGTMLQAWLDGMKWGGRTKRNYSAHVAALFRFAIKRKYLPKDALEEVQSVQQPKEDSGEIEIFTVAEMRELLAAARPEMLPFIAIGGFSGVRAAELARLDWSDVNLAERHIEIKASKAKTAARRLAPIPDNLFVWLRPYAKQTGKVISFESWWNQIPKLVQEVNERRKAEQGESGKDAGRKFKWKHNALRHSFCSYRLAMLKNAAQVSHEAGNSPQMIFANYRQLVSEAEGQKWFGIVPQTFCSEQQR